MTKIFLKFPLFYLVNEKNQGRKIKMYPIFSLFISTYTSIRSITKLTPTTKTWPDYERSMIRKPFYSIRMLFWPLWPYPQAFESVVFMTKNWWYLWNSKVALFLYCCSLQWQYKYWDLSPVTECTMSPQQLP